MRFIKDLFGKHDEKTNRRNRAIDARNREMKKMCRMLGKEFKPMKHEK